ncbi:unnamed protein product [Dovyalis caffra]|uniref:30S ribosomal protein S16, chloroplastic n=1 Tax=Dovyalis caffra TaxID=77055 RepID=A0AAV1S5Z6_9ROSI|nr:unnamed protein product [Dovyalis caffra]
MAVKIRLARLGCKNRAFYRIIAADSHTPRDGKHLQALGFYDPLAALAVQSLECPQLKSEIFKAQRQSGVWGYIHVASSENKNKNGKKQESVRHGKLVFKD